MIKRISTIVIFISIFSLEIKGQNKDNYFFNSFEFGSSLTVVGDVGYTQELWEFTWNINFATSLGNHFYVGVQVLNIFIDYPNIETKKYNIFGLFSQYNIAPNSKFRPFLELSINKGDYYFPYYSNYPSAKNIFYYVGAGGGCDIPLNFISKHLFLDLSFIFYLQENEGKIRGDIYNQYIVGLNYRFGKITN